MRKRIDLSYLLLPVCFAIMSSCGGPSATEAPAGPVVIKTAGTAMLSPVFDRWKAEFGKAKENSKTQLEYSTANSAENVNKLMEGGADMAATDNPLSDEELAKFKSKPFHIPTIVGAVVVVYNVPSIKSDLQLDGEMLAKMYLGQVREWNDPDMVTEHPKLNLPPTTIQVAHRSDPNGATRAFTEYLSNASSAWKGKVGAGPGVTFPVGKGFAGNEEVAAFVKKTPSSIGYVDRSFAIKEGLQIALVKNASGAFVKADLSNIAAAADSVMDPPQDLRMNVTNAPGKNAYPMTTFTYLLVPSQVPDTAKRRAMKNFLRWTMEAGQNEAMGLDYGTLSQPVSSRALKSIDAIQQ